jgi:hypothetical protein
MHRSAIAALPASFVSFRHQTKKQQQQQPQQQHGFAL